MKSPILMVLILQSAVAGLFADVTSWRNGGRGLYPGSQAPTHWQDPETILWKVNLPVWGNACPILVGDKLFYTAEPTELICADAKTGKILWQRSNGYEDVAHISPGRRREIKQAILARERLQEILEPLKKKDYQISRRLRGDPSNQDLKSKLEEVRREMADREKQAGAIPKEFQKPKTHDTNGFASYTPCSDGNFIYACNGLGIVTKYDLDGNLVWGRIMEQPDHNWGGAVSPQLVGGKLIVRFADYAALDPQNGDERWRVEDPHTSGPPASFQREGKWFLYTVRGELIRVEFTGNCPLTIWARTEAHPYLITTPPTCAPLTTSMPFKLKPVNRKT